MFTSFFNLFIIYVFRVFYPLNAFNKLKSFLLRKRGAKVGTNVFFHQNVFISSMKKLIIGDNVVISRGVLMIATGEITIGNNVLIGYDTKILTANHVIPEVGSDVLFMNSGHDYKPVVIEDNVWIASNVVVLPGVKIASGSIVAAGAVVTKDTEPNGIYAGVPAKFIKSR